MSDLSRFRAALRLLSPDHITPQGRRILERVLAEEEQGCSTSNTPATNPTKGTTMGDTAYVIKLPDCDICKYNSGVIREAHYDGKTRMGPWANMCEAHFQLDGLGLGTGVGQRLVVRGESASSED